MTSENNPKVLNFLYEYNNKDPLKVLLLLIISLGIYLPFWIYATNRNLEKVQEDSPESKRCFFVLIVIPTIWIIISTTLTQIIPKQYQTITMYINLICWTLIALLILKFIYDFCNAFGKFTDSEGLGWYLLLYPTFYSVIFTISDFEYSTNIVLFPLITIPMMQKTINDLSTKAKIRRRSESFKGMRRINS